jgi:hypothetical protein
MRGTMPFEMLQAFVLLNEAFGLSYRWINRFIT